MARGWTAWVVLLGLVSAVACGRPDQPGAQTALAPAAAPAAPAAAPAAPDAGTLAATAQGALQRATLAAAAVQAEALSAEAAAREAAALAAPASARDPGSSDPQSRLQQVEASLSRVQERLAALQQEEAAAGAAAEAAQRLSQAPGAAAARAELGEVLAAAGQVQALAAAARTALGTVQSAYAQAEAAARAWANVHGAPAGYLGVQTADPLASWTVRGCEVISVLPDTPAAFTSLVGRSQRLDPVGDVLYGLLNQSAEAKSFRIERCADLTRALAQTRVGDQVVLQYFHRVAAFPVGSWENKQTFAVLASRDAPKAPAQGCSPPLSGAFDGSGHRLRVSVAVAGPAGQESVQGIIDTGAGVTTFSDAYLRRLGFRPVWPFGFPVRGVGSGPVQGYLYRIPFPLVRVGGEWVPLGRGTLEVTGITGGFPFGVLLGPDALVHSALRTSGSAWTLYPPCG